MSYLTRQTREIAEAKRGWELSSTEANDPYVDPSPDVVFLCHGHSHR